MRIRRHLFSTMRVLAPIALVMVSVPAMPAMTQGEDPVDDRAIARDTTSGDDADQVVQSLQALFAAVERGDLTALDTLYAGDSLTVIEGAGLNRTWADYRDHHLAPELKEMKGMAYRPSEIEPHVAGNVAWAIFRYTLTGSTTRGPIDIVGRGTAVLERRGPRWVVRHTHTGGRARRPSDPPAK